MKALESILAGSRYLVLFAVAGTLLAAACVYVGTAVFAVEITIDLIVNGVSPPDAIKSVAVSYMRAVDLFLIATAFQIISAGMYRLFINPEFTVSGHLSVRSFRELKQSLASIVAVVLMIIFLDYVVTEGPTELTLPFGLAIAAMIAAVAWTIRFLGVRTKER